MRGAVIDHPTSSGSAVTDPAEKPTLGAVMIVKNEEQNLGRILSDIRGIVDEICVVDTGSTDSTVSLAKSFGAKIGHFSWCDDFSAARNASIALAESDYLLWLDADDHVTQNAAADLRSLKRSLDPGKKAAYFLTLLNTPVTRGSLGSIQLRIFPNIEMVRFEGRIHEQILPSLERTVGIRFVNTGIAIHHTGYADQSSREAKQRRNLAIQLDELSEGTHPGHRHFMIAMTYYGIRDHDKCLEHIREARKCSGREGWYLTSSFLATDIHLRQGRTDEALEEAGAGVARFPRSGYMHYGLGMVFFRLERYGEAVQSFLAAQRYGFEVDGYAKPSDIRALLPYSLGRALEKTGKFDQAAIAYRNSIEMNPDWILPRKALGFALISEGKVDEALTHLEHAYGRSANEDIQVVLALARLYRHAGRTADAHTACLKALEPFPDDLGILAATASTGIACAEMQHVESVLEQLMKILGMSTDLEIESAEELALLCSQIGQRLFEQDQFAAASAMAEASTTLDPRCWSARLLASDISRAEGKITSALSLLKDALLSGAPSHEVETRMALFDPGNLS